MLEEWDLYDRNRNLIGSGYRKDFALLKEGEYHLAVEGIILNSRNEILISQRAKHKTHPLKWECNGGSVLKGETSLEGILRELKEELGLVFTKEEATLFKTVFQEENHTIKDFWLFQKEIPIEEVSFPDGEAVSAKWVTFEELLAMEEAGLWVSDIEIVKEILEK